MGLKVAIIEVTTGSIAFQTYPRGVEGAERAKVPRGLSEFQTYPRGVEGLETVTGANPRIEFQTYPRGVEGSKSKGWAMSSQPVSDVPSWG